MRKRSWKTSAAGIAAIVVAVGGAVNTLCDGDPATMPDWAVVGVAVAAGIGLLTARDDKVTSEQARAK